MITNSGAAIILFALFSCGPFPRLLMQAIVFFSFFSGTAVDSTSVIMGWHRPWS